MKIQIMVATAYIVFLTACTPAVTSVAPVPATMSTSPAIATATHRIAAFSPTTTASPTMQPTSTIPAATLHAVATKDAIRGRLEAQLPELANYSSYCRLDRCRGVDVSPDGAWIYFSNDNVIEVFKTTGERLGAYSFYEIYGQYHGYSQDFLEGYVEGVHWSNDGRYLYIATHHGDGGPGPFFGYKSSLVRVNLQNGTWKDTGISGVLSFSPDEKYITYSTNRGEIRVRHLQSGEENIYNTPEPYSYFGEFIWSPDRKKIIFVATAESPDDPEGRFALPMIDLERDQMTLLYEGQMPFYFPVAWADENTVSLRRYGADGTWTLDLSISPPIIHP